MMISNYVLFLDLITKINELNEKLNEFTGKYRDNVLVGAVAVVVILAVAYAGINALNK